MSLVRLPLAALAALAAASLAQAWAQTSHTGIARVAFDYEHGLRSRE